MLWLLSSQIRCLLRKKGVALERVDALGSTQQGGCLGYWLGEITESNETGTEVQGRGVGSTVPRWHQVFWGLLCLRLGTGWFASSEEDVHGQEVCSVSCWVAGAL